MLALLPAFASAQILCFATSLSAKRIRLQLALPQEGTITGFVRYEWGSSHIPLVWVSEVAVSPPPQVPAVVKTTFAEQINGKRTGQYVLTTQGASVGELAYSAQKDDKLITFYEDHDAAGGDACDWSEKRSSGAQ